MQGSKPQVEDPSRVWDHVTCPNKEVGSTYHHHNISEGSFGQNYLDWKDVAMEVQSL